MTCSIATYVFDRPGVLMVMQGFLDLLAIPGRRPEPVVCAGYQHDRTSDLFHGDACCGYRVLIAHGCVKGGFLTYGFAVFRALMERAPVCLVVVLPDVGERFALPGPYGGVGCLA